MADTKEDPIHSMHSDVLDADPQEEDDKQRLVDELKERGNLAFKAKRYQEASALYSKAIKVTPGKNAAVYSNRSMVRVSMKDFKGALEDGEACTAMDSKFAKGHYRVAVAHEKLKNWGPSYDAYKVCIELTPKGKARDKLRESSESMYAKACKAMREGDGAAPAPAPSKKVAADRFKKGGEAGGFGDGAAGSAVDALNSAKPKSSSVVIDDGDELEHNR
jgi:tetratricopeptide (TPR) repeat protein